jgi:hypothetical protein
MNPTIHLLSNPCRPASAYREYIEGVLQRVMIVVLLGCVGLTAGVAFGTVFSSPQISVSIMLPVQNRCHQDWRSYSPSDLAFPRGPHHPVMRRLTPGGSCLLKSPAVITQPSGGLPMGGYVLFGLVAGLSAALGFLVPPRSSVTAARYS